MKKKYATPRVEKIEFSYEETVTASWPEYAVPPCCRIVNNNNNNNNNNNSGGNTEAGGNPCYHVNNSPDYWNC